jgi:hypothetical protein
MVFGEFARVDVGMALAIWASVVVVRLMRKSGRAENRGGEMARAEIKGGENKTFCNV